MSVAAHDWVDAVRFAKDGDFEFLHELLVPALRAVARRIAPQCVEDAVAAGVMKVWQKIRWVDDDRPETMRAVIMTIGTNAMRDELRRVLAKARESPRGQLELEDSGAACVHVGGTVSSACLEYIERTGGTKGLFAAVGKRTGRSPTWVQSMVRQELAEQNAGA